MLTDRYELPLTTASSAARDAYVEGCEAKLTMYPGALEAFDRAIAALAADPNGPPLGDQPAPLTIPPSSGTTSLAAGPQWGHKEPFKREP